MKPERIVIYNTPQEPSAAFDKILKGVDLLANAVKQTLGPYGRNFLLSKSGGRITNDGITIAQEIQARDEVEDLALRIARQATNRTNEDAGDGTTTATTLVQAILHECSQYMGRGTKIARRSVVAMKKQLKEETELAITKLREMATPIETKEALIDAVMVSAEDRDLATLIGDTQWDLGPHGYIIPEETTEPVTTIERIAGVRIDNGLGTSMVMNDKERQRLVVEKCPVLLTNYVVTSLAPFTPALEALFTSGFQKAVIVARAFSSEAITHMMENTQKGGMQLYPVNAPYVNQRQIFEDLQAILGGRYIHDEASTLENITPEDFGFAVKVVGYRYTAIFTGALDSSERVKTLEEELKGEPSKFNKKALEQRLAQLKYGFALLKVGSLSDVDRKYKFDKAEDACNTARSALQEGTVPGAGLAFKAIAEQLPDDALLKRPLLAPHKQIMENAGGPFEVETWVRNSLKVDRVALENASHVAGDILTTCGVITTEKAKPIDTILANRAPQEE